MKSTFIFNRFNIGIIPLIANIVQWTIGNIYINKIRKPITYKEMQHMVAVLSKNKKEQPTDTYEQARKKASTFLDTVETTPPTTPKEDLSPLGTLGYLVTVARLDNKLTREQISTSTGLDLETLFLIERGMAPLEDVANYLELLCVSLGLDYQRTSMFINEMILRIED